MKETAHPVAQDLITTGNNVYESPNAIDTGTINPEVLSENDESTIVSQIRERYRIGKQGNNSAFPYIGNLDIYTGKKDVTVTGTKTQPKVKINIVKTAVDIISSILKDTPADILCYARSPDDEVRAIVWQKILDHIMEQNMMDYKRPQMQKFFLLMGTGIYKVVDGGDKLPQILVINPSRVVVDPVATNFDEIRWVTEVTIHNKTELKRMYPHYTPNSTQGVEPVQFPELQLMNSAEFQFARGLEIVYEHWDCVTKRRYVSTDWQVLENEDNAYPYDHPYIFMPCAQIPDRIYGDNIVTQSYPIQEELNIIYKKISQNIGLHGNPQKVYNADIVDPENLTNEPGLQIPVRGPVELRQAVAYLEPFTMSPALYQFVDKMEWFFNTQMNLSDVVLGRAVINSSLPAGRAIEDLQKSAMTRPRDMADNIRTGYTLLGKKLVALGYRIMDQEVEMKVTGKDLNTINMALHKDDQDAIKQMAQVGVIHPNEIKEGLKARHLDAGIQQSTQQQDTYYMKINPCRVGDPTKYDIRVKAGADVPHDKLDMAKDAKELYMTGKLDPQSYFEIAGFPNYETMLPRMQEWQAFQQWSKMQQQIQKQKQQQEINQQANPSQGGQNAPQGPQKPGQVPTPPNHPGSFFQSQLAQGGQPNGQ